MEKNTVSRKATKADLPRLLEVYAAARKFMQESGNPTQWTDGYPQQALVEQDIAQERLFVTARLPSTLDSAMTKASRSGVHSRYSILSTIRYIDWILPTLSGDNVLVRAVNREDYRHVTPLPDDSYLIQEPTEITVAREGEFYRDILAKHRTFFFFSCLWC